jgi:hypothetical protein
MQADYSFGVLGPQPCCISPDLFRIGLLKCKILDGCFHFGQLGRRQIPATQLEKLRSYRMALLVTSLSTILYLLSLSKVFRGEFIRAKFLNLHFFIRITRRHIERIDRIHTSLNGFIK